MRAEEILRDMLAWGRQHRRTITSFKTRVASLTRSEWLVIIGVGQKTRIRLTLVRDRRGPRFVIDDGQFVNELDADHPDSRLTGDGMVTLAAAIPPFLPASKLVCVTEGDLHFFELRDKLLVDIGGMHGLLPRINLVQRLVTKHFMPAYRGEVWGRRLPGASSWNPPINHLAEKSY